MGYCSSLFISPWIFAKLFESTVENRRFYERGYSEFLVRSVQISGIFYQSKDFKTYEEFASSHREMVDYAKETGIPIFVLPDAGKVK